MRGSFVLKRKAAVGEYLGVLGRGFDIVDVVRAFRFPTELLAKRYAEAASDSESAPDFEAKADVRPPLLSQSGSCRVCGCTESFACPGGCSWVEPDLCSACQSKATGS
ncbi:hypothetical protein [Rhodanobacter sp. FW106-PBR-LB-2-11]|uniref:hypothetical protein n=1 Tax=Rhodanobacter sp. FW106-PBR-LB-2-11 TaxID=1524463 RepID=UPI0034E444E4